MNRVIFCVVTYEVGRLQDQLRRQFEELTMHSAEENRLKLENQALSTDAERLMREMSAAESAARLKNNFNPNSSRKQVTSINNFSLNKYRSSKTLLSMPLHGSK